MRSLQVSFVVLIGCVSCLTGFELPEINRDLDWWEGGNFYQIYPRSWKDSNGDGIGDLIGIKQNISYLKTIGMDGVW